MKKKIVLWLSVAVVSFFCACKAEAQIVSSTTVSNIIQADGRQSIVERHTASDGAVITRVYKAPASAEASVLLAEHAVSIGESLKTSEADQFTEWAADGIDVSGMSTKYTTKRLALKALLKSFLQSDAARARNMLATLNSLSDVEINADYSAKLVKIKRRRNNLNEIQVIVNTDLPDVETE